MAKDKRSYEEMTSDPAAQEMLIRADELGIGTAFSRADDMVPCNIGGAGMCCDIGDTAGLVSAVRDLAAGAEEDPQPGGAADQGAWSL